MKRYGDAYEYLFMTQAIQDHLTPNLTDGDIARVKGALVVSGVGMPDNAYSGFYPSNSGGMFSYHFWLYSLVNVPVKMVAEIFTRDSLRIFQFTNILLFLFALWSFYAWADLEKPRKIVAVCVLALNPILWYLSWWSPEAFTYSLVLVSITAFTRRQYAPAALIAAVASTQNPPLLFLGAFYGVMELGRYWPGVRLSSFLKLIPAGLIVALPFVFYLVNYNAPSLIMKVGAANINNMSAQRMIDLLLDLNSGILPYLPEMMIFFFLAVGYNLVHRKWNMLVWVVIVFFLMLFSTQTSVWNSDTAGMQRYAIWMIPIMVFIIFSTFALHQWMKWVWVVGATFQVFIIGWYGGLNQIPFWLNLSPIAEFTLDHYPSLYSPEPAIFVDRVLGQAVSYPQNTFAMYTTQAGVVTKMWTDYQHFSALQTINNIGVDIHDVQQYKSIRAELKNQNGFHYVNMNGVVISIKPKVEIPTKRLKSKIQVLDAPTQVKPGETFTVKVKITNESDFLWFYFGGQNTLNASYHWIGKDGSMVQFEGIRTLLPSFIFPGDEESIEMTVTAPQAPGEYQLEGDVVWELIGWFSYFGNSPAIVPIQVIEN